MSRSTADRTGALDSAPNGADWSEERVRTPRLALRPWMPADAPAVHAACADPEIQRWLPLPSPYTPADAEHWVTEGGQLLRRAGDGLACAVVDRSTDRLVGSVELRLHPTLRHCAEVGYWIAAWARGRRYAAEAVDGLCRWAYRHGVVRVELRTAVPNVASQRVAMRAGFVREGLARSGAPAENGFDDAVVFARLATDPGTPAPRPLPDLDELSDGVVSVRPLGGGDEAAVAAERSDAEVKRWSPTSGGWTRADAERLARSAASAWLSGTEARFAIVDAATGRYVGSVGLRMTVPAFGVAELGYSMLPGWRRRGYMTRALNLIRTWAFDQVGLVRLELGTALGNRASQHTAERAGFAREGVAKRRLPTPDGGRVDEVRYGLTRPDVG